MSKKLAIKGHETRGNEVIEILRMLGGSDNGSWLGSDIGSAYYINDWTQKIDVCTVETDIVVFTLEEFLKEFPFKVGDKVIDCYGNTLTIKSMSWHDEFETIVYDFKETEDVFCAEDLELYKEDSNMRDKEGKLFDSIIWHLRNSINNGKQDISGGDCERYFRELVDKVKETNMDKETITPSPDITAEVIDKNNCDIQCPDGYEFYDENENIIGTKVMMRPKKPKYPTTYGECCERVNACPTVSISYDSDEDMLYNDEVDLTLLELRKLLICRNAYWEIAGEEMGLDKPWDSTYGCGEWGYWIGYSINENKTYLQDCRILVNHTLVFPTEEMRDAFYENFKDLIEQCKELL